MNSNSRQLTLYSSPDCLLCDEAIELLQHSGSFKKISINKKDIYSDKGLLIKYKLHIPVLQDTVSGKELPWPFDIQMFERWFHEL